LITWGVGAGPHAAATNVIVTRMVPIANTVLRAICFLLYVMYAASLLFGATKSGGKLSVPGTPMRITSFRNCS
jgi:hypothetical protein